MIKNLGTGNNMDETENKIATMVMVIVSIFAICNSPEGLLNIFILYLGGEADVNLTCTIWFLCCFSSSMNAVIYGIFNTKYREKLFALLCPCKKKDSVAEPETVQLSAITKTTQA